MVFDQKKFLIVNFTKFFVIIKSLSGSGSDADSQATAWI
jgi:hypothetical protein